MSSANNDQDLKIATTNGDPTSWKHRFQFPLGAKILIFFQLFSGMGNYGFILSMPLYMTSILRFSDTTSTIVFHAKSGIGALLNIAGAILADSFLGRSKTFLYIHPCNLALMATVSIVAIYTQTASIIVCYFLIGVVSGLVGPAIRTIISDQIASDDKIMLGTYLHIIYLINNFGVIIISFVAPIIHKDIYCFSMECYPLVFFIAFLLMCLAFTIFLVGFFTNLFVIYKPTENLLLNIFNCIRLAVTKRITLGKPPEGQTWLDYSKEKFDPSFIKDIKIVKGLLIFLLAHPLFWTVFEQMSSVWTLQAQYMDGMMSGNYVIKADQMQTLNPILVVLLIPIFELTIYPLLGKINFKVPYRIMTGQIFTALACVSMIFIQLRIDSAVENLPKGSVRIHLINLARESLSMKYSSASFIIPQWDFKVIELKSGDNLNLKLNQSNWNISENIQNNKMLSIITYDDKRSPSVISAEVSRQKNGGYTNVRIFNNFDSNYAFSIFLKAKVGINKDFTLTANLNEYGKYAKCGVGLFDVFFQNPDGSNRKNIGQITLRPAETIMLIITGNQTVNKFIPIQELKLHLPTIFWQIIPYVLVTIGEVLFNVNTGIFLYGEAPMSMKSMLIAAEFTCIALGNVLILILKKVLGKLSMVYLFIICASLVALSGVFTGVLGYFYLKNKIQQDPMKDTTLDSTNL